MKKLLFILCLLLGATSFSAQGLKTNVDEYRKVEVSKTLALDYSIPDYSTCKIDEKVMGHRLATILERILECYNQNIYKSTLSIIQSGQVDGLSYGRIKNLKLDNVTKNGNKITISFITTLEPNNLKLKKAQIVFLFVDGASEDVATNDFFTSICRYIKER